MLNIKGLRCTGSLIKKKYVVTGELDNFKYSNLRPFGYICNQIFSKFLREILKNLQFPSQLRIASMNSKILKLLKTTLKFTLASGKLEKIPIVMMRMKTPTLIVVKLAILTKSLKFHPKN